MANDRKVDARAIDDTSVTDAAKATDSNGVKEPMGKRARKGGDQWHQAPGPGKPQLPTSNIHLVELLNDSEVDALVGKGFNRDAIEKLRRLSVGELERIGLINPRSKDYEALRQVEAKMAQARAQQKARALRDLQRQHAEISKRIASPPQVNLFKKLQASASARGGVVEDFLNEFWERPGFHEVVLNWAKGGISQRGTNFVMKYALAKYRGRAIRFEWPVGVSRSMGGAEGTGPARYVDIVVDGGTQMRPGESLRIELKSWTDRYLKRLLGNYEFEQARVARLQDSVAGMQKELSRLQAAAAKNEKEIARLQKAVDEKKNELQAVQERLAGRKQQLVRDTAFFTPENTRWVFNSELATEEAMVKTFVELIRKDDFLRKHWGGTVPEIEATLKRVIEMSTPGS